MNNQWLWSYSIHKVPTAITTPACMPMRPRLANDHDIANLWEETVPINFIWRESAQWLSQPQPRPFGPIEQMTTTLHIPRPRQWACLCGPDNADGQMTKWPRYCTSTSQESPSELHLEWICPVVAGFWRLQDSRSLCACPSRQMTITLHVYRPRRFQIQWTWFGVNPPSEYWIMASARFPEPLLHLWAECQKHLYFRYLVRRLKFIAPHKLCLIDGGRSWHPLTRASIEEANTPEA